jgi:hypothetical protein
MCPAFFLVFLLSPVRAVALHLHLFARLLNALSVLETAEQSVRVCLDAAARTESPWWCSVSIAREEPC